MDANQSHRAEDTVPSQDDSAPPAYSTSIRTAQQPTVDSPPDYQTVVQTPQASSSRGNDTQIEVESAEAPDPSILTIDKRLVVSPSSPQSPFYSLSHALDGHEASHGIMLTRIEQRPEGKRPIRIRRRDVFALMDRKITIGLPHYVIDGQRFLSGQVGFMDKKYTKSGQGWKSFGSKKLPSFVLRPVKLSSEAGGCGFEWRDKDTGKVVATETRRTWDKKNKTELTPPKLELESPRSLSPEYFDFLVATWCMHNWREAKDMTKEPISWEEFKEEAKTTAKNTKKRRWNLSLGGLGAGIA